LNLTVRNSISRVPEVFVSAASAWEIVIKLVLGQLRFEGTIGDAFEVCHFVELVVATRHAGAVPELPRHHSDPFDCILIAQARVEALTIVTHDRAFEVYRVPIVLM
jgi:PIN domain nuclease of toxin-antitoxin system